MWTNTTEREFWDFSWHEMGVYDLPAQVDYVLRTTGQRAMHFVGISQGGTVFLVLNSMMPQYNAVFKSATLLAPVAYVSNTKSGLAKVIGPVLGTRNYVSKMLEGVEMFSTNKFFKKFLSMTCLENEKPLVCISRLWPAVGYDTRFEKTALGLQFPFIRFWLWFSVSFSVLVSVSAFLKAPRWKESAVFLSVGRRSLGSFRFHFHLHLPWVSFRCDRLRTGWTSDRLPSYLIPACGVHVTIILVSMRRERVVLLCLALLGLQQVSRATVRQSREIIITDAVCVPWDGDGNGYGEGW